MHIGTPPQVSTRPAPPANDGGEEEQAPTTTTVSSQCTQVCGPGQAGRSCSKICLVRVYYQAGRKAEGFLIESLDGQIVLSLPPLIECNEILNDRSEIPTPDAARCQPHLRKIAEYIPELDPNAEILILLGRDVLRVHKHYRTNVLENGRPSICTPCNNSIKLIENLGQGGEQKSKPCKASLEALGQNIFNETSSDNKPGPSMEDTLFLELMDKEMFRDESNHWVAPLPFRPHANCSPTIVSMHCLASTHCKRHCIESQNAKSSGMSLNNTLLKGPDLNNSLIGVLVRFRKEQVAVLADIQQMFHCFLVRRDHRNYLRFLWHRDNDMSKDIIDYRMRVHVFGNSHHPLWPSTDSDELSRKKLTNTVQIQSSSSCATFTSTMASLAAHRQRSHQPLQRTQASLRESNLRLHKFASNSDTVLHAFAPEDRAVLKDLDLSGEATPVQRSLGLLWVTTTDTFTFKVSEDKKDFTRRGVLSTVNSVFDPLGMLAPVTIEGKSLLREFCADNSDWDAPLPKEKLKEWEAWRDSLHELSKLHIPRAYTAISLSNATHTELCVFSDASVKAIGAVAYLKIDQDNGQVDVGFVLGKAKLAPLSQPTIPRLELCAAVLAVEVADLIQMNWTCKYILSNSIVTARILQSTKPDQWFYVSSENNPADHASRLKHAGLNTNETNPVILPKNSHISLLLLRRKAEVQLMANLPPERLQVSPPFTYVGVDVFGPWPVVSRRTRGGQAESKRWAMLFCCMSSRAVHIETIASLDTTSCINALRRFFAIRGPAKQIRSDCGTNFVAAAKELGLSQKEPNGAMQKFLSEQNCEWVFNVPHASHMGGSWERLIGLSRRILDAMLLKNNIQLTHDTLCTLMMEVAAIINARPLVPVSNDPEAPSILSPAMILTQKVGVAPPPGQFTNKDLYSKQWRQVQALADEFWRRWPSGNDVIFVYGCTAHGASIALLGLVLGQRNALALLINQDGEVDATAGSEMLLCLPR
ncbi:hypothetical protein WMY93_023869 [Mugilogobius chulae]|uniref:Integrase catalytic domain-containing protein n=1 Tax=Mugilogobius chulae TaxID=88201 RepID=A0AAW0N6Z0_9GOBI